MNIESVRRYFDLNKKERYQKIEDNTASDLNIDEVFERIDFTKTPIGQQFLYNTLRSIPTGESVVAQNEKWIDHYSGKIELQKKLDNLFLKLDDYDSFSIYPLIIEDHKPFSKLQAFIFHCLQFIPTALLLVFLVTKSWFFVIALTLFFSINLYVHYYSKAKLFYYKGSIPMLRQLIYICRKLNRDKELGGELLNNSEITEAIYKTKKTYRQLSNYRFGVKLESDIAMIAWLISELVSIFFLSEVVNLNNIFKRIRTNRKELICIFEYVGLIDTLSSVSRMREDVDYYSLPCFSGDSYRLDFKDIYHPLIENCVPNSLSLNKKSYLVLGANMSGKTSFIRTVGINLIIAQTLNTSFSKQMILSKQKIYSVIAVSDNLVQGHSYYLSEVLRMKRLIDNTQDGSNLILLDELFKGTNTKERIASAKAVLNFLFSNKYNRILAATHDLELTTLLADTFEQIFFEEKIDENNLSFDYKIAFKHSGRMNAIRILELYQFPQEIIEEALITVKTKG